MLRHSAPAIGPLRNFQLPARPRRRRPLRARRLRCAFPGGLVAPRRARLAVRAAMPARGRGFGFLACLRTLRRADPARSAEADRPAAVSAPVEGGCAGGAAYAGIWGGTAGPATGTSAGGGGPMSFLPASHLSRLSSARRRSRSSGIVSKPIRRILPTRAFQPSLSHLPFVSLTKFWSTRRSRSLDSSLGGMPALRPPLAEPNRSRRWGARPSAQSSRGT